MSKEITSELQKRWAWLPSTEIKPDSAAVLVEFYIELNAATKPVHAELHFTADTRYKLRVNGKRIAIGPTRSCSNIWYYCTLDIAPFCNQGRNVVSFEVLRFDPAKEGGQQFARTRLPGLTVYGHVDYANGLSENLSTDMAGWRGRVRDVKFPFGTAEDHFLHVFERTHQSHGEPQPLHLYGLGTTHGGMTPWNLRPRLTPFPVQQPPPTLKILAGGSEWNDLLAGSAIHLTPGRHHVVIQAAEYTTAFIKLGYIPSIETSLELLYAECYEEQPRDYPWLRVKHNRLQPGLLLGPSDHVSLAKGFAYEPFWFRTFRFIQLTISVGPEGLTLESLDLTQTNYPLSNAATWRSDPEMDKTWEVSVRTLRSCMFDGYSDCPFYEQLQYAEDTRSSGLFHYLLCGDDRLMRQAIVGFASSITADGLILARYPSHTVQIIPGFALFWILQVCDHHTYFADTAFAQRHLPTIYTVIDFFRRHIDSKGLVSGLSDQYWQFVDWAEDWKGTKARPEGGVPTAGRDNNVYTLTSLLLAYACDKAATLARDADRPSLASDFDVVTVGLREAVNTHCFDGTYYLDSTSDQPVGHSQHVQIFALLSGTASKEQAAPMLLDAFTNSNFAACSYVFTHYAFRALSMAGIYERLWRQIWAPWRKMLADGLSTWEEDTVSQRSDCHAWGSVALYEYPVEVAGLHCNKFGWQDIHWKPRIRLVPSVDCDIPLGRNNRAKVRWRTIAGQCEAELELERAMPVISIVDGQRLDHGVTQRVFVTVSL